MCPGPADTTRTRRDLEVLTLLGCVTDGPFAKLNVSMGPGNHTSYDPHCLRRDFSPWLFTQSGNQSVIDWTLDAADFWHLDYYVEGISLTATGMRVHEAGHMAIGGQIGEVSRETSSRKEDTKLRFTDEQHVLFARRPSVLCSSWRH